MSMERKQMTEKELSELTDKELLQEAKQMKYNSIFVSVVIGMFTGVAIYGVVINNRGLGFLLFFILIPSFFIYKLFNNSEHDKALKEVLKERNLK